MSASSIMRACCCGATLDQWMLCRSGDNTDGDIFVYPFHYDAMIAAGKTVLWASVFDPECYQLRQRAVRGQSVDPLFSFLDYLNDCDVADCCSCDGSDHDNDIEVVGYDTLVPCAACDASADPAWDGLLTKSGSPTLCTWGPAADPLSISGKLMSPSNTGLTWDGANCRWILRIYCLQGGGTNKCIWVGQKAFGNTPYGQYSILATDPTTLQTPCDSTPALNVIDIP